MSPPAAPTNVARVDFERLVDAHYAALYRFALSLAKNAMQARSVQCSTNPSL